MPEAFGGTRKFGGMLLAIVLVVTIPGLALAPVSRRSRVLRRPRKNC